MNIKTKYNIGQKVYEIDSYKHPIPSECSTCGGAKFAYFLNGNREYCRKCNGTGITYETYRNEWILSMEEKAKITGIEIYYKNEDISYALETNALIPEKNVFKTKKEALAECKKRNSAQDKTIKEEKQ